MMRPYRVIDPNLVASTDQTQANTDVAADLTVPAQAEGLVPSEVLPDGLPQVALDHMSETALAQLADDPDWLIS
jgi:hypothetical protein